MNPEEIQNILARIDPGRSEDREDWLKIGMALHAASGGSDEGLSLWDSWSRQSEKFREGECVKKWNGFSGGGVGAATLHYLARQDNGDGQSQRSRQRPATPPPAKHVETFATSGEAIAALEQRSGPCSFRWEYADANAQSCGFILRWNRQGGKDIRPVSRGEDGRWRIGAMSEPRPLYRLPEIRETGDDETLWICEGEKAADALADLGLESTTSAGGSQAPHKTDWTPLAGRDCVILPDADDPGEKYAETVCGILHSLRPPAAVRILRLPGLPSKGDAFDFIESKLAVAK